MIEILSRAIDRLSAFVFFRVPFFGTEIEAIVLWLAVPMLLFTLWLGFINIRGFPLALRLVRGHFHDPHAPGNVSQFAALSTALSGTIGLGNIAGVAIAISTGGPGAAFWMLVIGFFAMTLKCAEVTLGLKYREIGPDGRVHGGPMYTLKNGLSARGLPRIGLFFGGTYAVLALGGAIPLVQVNQSFAQVSAVTGFTNGWAYGIIMAAMVAVVVIGGVGWLARVTSILVPAMCLVYLIGVAAVLIFDAAAIPDAILTIWNDAWSGEAVAGGAVGAFVIGMRRAVYSSEAGIGSAVIAHSAARTHEPVSEGLVALIEPFLDTVIVCSLGALMIVVAGTWNDGLEGVAITSAAFGQVASWFPAVLAVAVFLFGYSTLIAWGYYGLQAWGYLFGHSWRAETLYKAIYCLILPVGAVLDLGRVIDLIDSAFFLMAIPNIAALYLFAPELRRDVFAYLSRMRAAPAKTLGAT